MPTKNQTLSEKLPFVSHYSKEYLKTITRSEWMDILSKNHTRPLLLECYSALLFRTHSKSVDGVGFSKFDTQRAELFNIALKDDSNAEHILGPSIVFLYKYRNQLYNMHRIRYPDCLFEVSP